MTKKHYEMIARAINHEITLTRYEGDVTPLKNLAERLSREFQSDNARFDRQKFLSACGAL